MKMRDETSHNTLSTRNYTALSLPSSPIALIMQRTAHSISMLISCQPESKDPAPIKEGSRAGYFDDRLTRHLLALTSEEILLSLGTYGSKDLGQTPVDITILRESSYNRRLLPFAPRGSCMVARNLDLHKLNHQWRTYTQTAKDLGTQLDEAIRDASDIARQVSLSLPEYARQLVPKLLYQAGEESKFPLQLQAFFSPSALCARVAHIICVIGMLEAYINLGHRILSNHTEWKFKEPVGLTMKIEFLMDKDSELLKAYLFLGLPIEFDGHYPLTLISGYSLDDAKTALRGLEESDTSEQLSIGSSPEELNSDDDDALKFAVIFPEYDMDEYNSDGTTVTLRQKKDKKQMLQEEAQASGGEEDSTPSPHPTEDEAMQMDTVTSALGVVLGKEPAGSQTSPAEPSTMFVSPGGSVSAISSSSSSNLPYLPDSSSLQCGTGPKPSRHSWHWTNRHQRGPNRGPESPSSRRFEPYTGPNWRDSARSQTHNLQVQ